MQRPTAETWLPVLRDALAREGAFRFSLRGNSMRPTLPVDCTIDVRPLPPHVRPGALIVFAAGDALIAHRLVRRKDSAWIAQGDGRLAPDLPLASQQVLGTVGAAFDGTRPIWPGPAEPLLALFWVARHHCLRPVRWAWRKLRRR